MNFVRKIVVYQFVVERGVTVESGFSIVSLFWVLAMAWVLELWLLFRFKGCCGEVLCWNLKVGFVLAFVGRSAGVLESCRKCLYGCCSMILVMGLVCLLFGNHIVVLPCKCGQILVVF